MRLRERLRLLLTKFEKALTRVEDQGQRVENGVEDIKRMMAGLNDAVGRLEFDVNERYQRGEKEVTALKQRMHVLERRLGQAPPTN